ncbi:Molybdenum-pterin-binding protein MopA [Methyloligella halotolerans]|uniref:Molybdenum-pterin-binding protein MopA n=1 Tax=Methyloligella halotolerans TaxID=1177755 RepID=A0A1E2RX99_9HYPH|nr:LysR family transcriptional regulator [Methyloligella halotolerans]ODA66782.1 Molybdenum-pterin-binding protein MopA [Methyloligella halotolerans]
MGRSSVSGKQGESADTGQPRTASAGTAKSGHAKGQKPFPRLRIPIADGLVLGPGKIELLEAIGRTGSISAGGREMGMSYRRAWLLVDALNRMFAKPLILTATGGTRGGGAQVTDEGRAVVSAYRRAEERTKPSSRKNWPDCH